MSSSTFVNRVMQFSECAGDDKLFFIVLPAIIMFFSLGTLIWNYGSWYSEHLRSFELTSLGIFSVHQLSELNDTICSEFHKITNVNLKNHFYAVLDQHAPCLQSLFRKKAARTGKVSEVLSQLFRIYDLQEKVDVHVRRAAVLRALPAYLQEDDSNVLKTWDVEQSNEPDIDDVPLGLVSISGT